MRWLVMLLLVLGLVGAVAKSGCHVREFYGIAYTVHDPTLRHKEIALLQVNRIHGDLEQPSRVGGRGRLHMVA